MSEILNAPHKIYLNIKEEHEDGEVIDFFDCQEITWSEDPALDVTLGFINIESYEATSKELEELQDAIADKFLHDPVDPDKFKILINAIKQSMERAKQ
jgi:hypothetical protein